MKDSVFIVKRWTISRKKRWDWLLASKDPGKWLQNFIPKTPIEETTWENGTKEGFRQMVCECGDRIELLYAFFWVIHQHLNFTCQHFGTLCSIFTGLWRWNRHSVLKCWHVKFRCWGITQKKAYNIQNMAKVWNQDWSGSRYDVLGATMKTEWMLGFSYRWRIYGQLSSCQSDSPHAVLCLEAKVHFWGIPC